MEIRQPLSGAYLLRLAHTMQGLQIHIESIYTELRAAHSDWQREHDIRLAVFSAIQETLMNTRLSLNSYRDDLIPLFISPNVADFAPLPFPGEPRQYKILLDYEDYIWRSYFNPLFQQIETAFRLLIRHLAPGACHDGRGAFATVYATLLRTHLDGYPPESIELLDLLRHYRNSLHNYGIVRGTTDQTVIYKGRSYTFKRETVIAISWEFALMMTKDLVDLLAAIMRDGKVTGHTTAMPWPGWDLVRPDETSRTVEISYLTHSDADLPTLSELYALGFKESRGR